MDEEVLYLHLPVGSVLPDLESSPSRIVLLVEQDVDTAWQDQISDWIVSVGCLYMMAWGKNCSSWDDSVDWANIRAWHYKEIPDEHFILTTWHDHEPMKEVFVHCRLCAFHPTIPLSKVYIVDIADASREREILERYVHCIDDLKDEIPTPFLSRLTSWFNQAIKRK